MIGSSACRADRHHGVGHAHAVGQTARGADADDPLDAELDELGVVDRRAGATHADRLHADRPPLERAGVAEHAPLFVDAAAHPDRRTSRRCTWPAAGSPGTSTAGA